MTMCENFQPPELPTRFLMWQAFVVFFGIPCSIHTQIAGSDSVIILPNSANVSSIFEGAQAHHGGHLRRTNFRNPTSRFVGLDFVILCVFARRRGNARGTV